MPYLNQYEIAPNAATAGAPQRRGANQISAINRYHVAASIRQKAATPLIGKSNFGFTTSAMGARMNHVAGSSANR